jgi:O-antigen biosynthesis protein
MNAAERSGSDLLLPSLPPVRPVIRGKFLSAEGGKLYVRGATYGTFALDDRGGEVFTAEKVERDFALMNANGINALRTYTVPPRWVLDAAYRHRLRVMVGLPWEEHVAFLDDRERIASIEARVRHAIRQVGDHPAILAYTVGNEIPSGVVRWYGRRRIERFIERLYRAVKSEDPTALVTYVNYPTTEYLELPFLDVVCFNLYLEREAELRAYLARLQNIAGDRPLLMGEVGLDSRRNGEEHQAQSLVWQLRAIYEAGCAGAFVYAWTDEWHRGGYPILDWDFGLIRRDRSPKPALAGVRDVFAGVPFPSTVAWPRISAVVCAYNALSTIRECLDGLMRLDYPDFEVIVVNDGSTDATGTIASEYPVRLITTSNRGLSNARNTGLEAATGEIVAYIDSDAFPDPQWLKYLAAEFLQSDRAGVGGPNVAPPNLGIVAECFDNAPGGPAHVLLNDREAEHIPGCNMAFRRERLAAIGGFDPSLRVAGDDVDVCWRLQERGWTLGFSPAALVWHHRRTTLRSYWKQQRGYGRAEALLERKWPEKYNELGHTTWGGRIYAKGVALAVGFRPSRVYHGLWGSAPFQSLESRQPELAWSLALMPEWFLVVAALAALSAVGASWPPLLLALPLLVFAAALPVVQATRAASRARFETSAIPRMRELALRAFVAFLHLVQPAARLRGRLEFGLTWWRRPVTLRVGMLRTRCETIWTESWRGPTAWLETLEERLRAAKARPTRGGEYDAWDLELPAGAFGGARMTMLLEEHGAGRQLARFRLRPRVATASWLPAALCWALAVAAGSQRAWPACAILGIAGAAIASRGLLEAATAMDCFHGALQGLREIFNRQR